MIKKIIKKIIPWLDQSEKIYRYYIKANKIIKKNPKNKIIAYFYCYKCQKKYGCIISPHAKIGKNLLLPHPIGIVIGEQAVIGDNVTIYQNTTIGRKKREKIGYPKIGNNVTIYSNSVIIGDIKIGNNATIGCNSVVLRDVKDGETVYGIVK